MSCPCFRHSKVCFPSRLADVGWRLTTFVLFGWALVLRVRDVPIYDRFLVRLIRKLEAGNLANLRHIDIARPGGRSYPHPSNFGFYLLLVAWLRGQYKRGNRRIRMSETMCSVEDSTLRDVLLAVTKHWGMTQPYVRSLF
jgi:hypothetical protein